VNIVERDVQDGGIRWSYRLTAKGDALRPVLIALNHWALDWSDS